MDSTGEKSHGDVGQRGCVCGSFRACLHATWRMCCRKKSYDFVSDPCACIRRHSDTGLSDQTHLKYAFCGVRTSNHVFVPALLVPAFTMANASVPCEAPMYTADLARATWILCYSPSVHQARLESEPGSPGWA